MRTLPLRRRVLAAGAALALTLAAVPAAAAPAAPDKNDKDAALSPLAKLRQALDQPITIKFENQTLSGAVEQLRKAAHLNIVVDSLTIQQTLGYLPEQSPPMGAVDLKDVKVRTALRTILAPYGLDYVPISDTVVVTTEDMAMTRQLRQLVTVDFDKVPFAAALKQMARDTAVNLILDSRCAKEAEAKVSLHLEDVPLETAVRLMAELADLKPVRVGNVLFITSKDNANEMRQDPDIAQPAGARAEQLQQLQQLQIQLGAQAPGLGGAVPAPAPGVVAPPPNVQPAVPPAVEVPKEEDRPKEQSESPTPPPEQKPLTK